MRLIEKTVAMAVVLTILFSFLGFTAECEDIPNHIVRLHILANSDSEDDQQLKLKVRDRILVESEEILDGARSKQEAIQRIHEKIPQLQKIARCV